MKHTDLVRYGAAIWYDADPDVIGRLAGRSNTTLRLTRDGYVTQVEWHDDLELFTVWVGDKSIYAKEVVDSHAALGALLADHVVYAFTRSPSFTRRWAHARTLGDAWQDATLLPDREGEPLVITFDAANDTWAVRTTEVRSTQLI